MVEHSIGNGEVDSSILSGSTSFLDKINQQVDWRGGGWKSEKMVLRYAHVNASYLANSIDALPWTVEQAEPVSSAG